MKALLLLALAIASPAWGQFTEQSFAGMSPQQRADYRKLMFGYRDTFRVLGRSTVCRLDFDAEPFFREVESRHGEGSEPVLIARMSYASGAQNVLLSRDLDPTPPAPIPCDLLQYLRSVRLPEVPPSLR